MFKEFGEVECVRFRGAARPDPKTTKRVSVIKRKFNEKHQRIIAYVRFDNALLINLTTCGIIWFSSLLCSKK